MRVKTITKFLEIQGLHASVLRNCVKQTAEMLKTHSIYKILYKILYIRKLFTFLVSSNWVWNRNMRKKQIEYVCLPEKFLHYIEMSFMGIYGSIILVVVLPVFFSEPGRSDSSNEYQIKLKSSFLLKLCRFLV